MANKLRILVVGCGHMGISHARAYHKMSADFDIVGLVSRGPASRQKLNAEFAGRYAEFSDYATALAQTKPQAVCISTYAETHAEYAIAAMEAGAHVFLEKPVADTLADCERVIATARRLNRALIVGRFAKKPALRKFLGAFALFLLAFAGIPLTSGFIGKFSIFSAAYESGSTAILIAGVLSSAIAAFFYIRVIVLMFFKDPVEDGTSVLIPSALTTVTISISAAITLILGIYPAPLIDFINANAYFLR
jgi:hypothetical protein